MDVKVSKMNIKYGRREDPNSCPIALALKDMGFRRVAVRGDEVLIATGKTCYKYSPSPRASSFIDRFDDNVDKKHFKPTTFRFGLKVKKPLAIVVDVEGEGEFWK